MALIETVWYGKLAWRMAYQNDLIPVVVGPSMDIRHCLFLVLFPKVGLISSLCVQILKPSHPIFDLFVSLFFFFF